MKPALICVYVAALTAFAAAQRSPFLKAASADGSSDDDSIDAGTVRPAGSKDESDDSNSGGATDDPPGTAPTSPLDRLKQATYKNEWHMKPVRVIHARVQNDAPALIDGRFVSSFGNGDLAKGYLSAMDNVNTASVEGALMYVQAEGINVNSRAPEDRCTRKNNMRNIVFYDIVVVQTNESIAEFASSWKNVRDTYEYGPMVPMDGGRCTAESGSGTKERLPRACQQYNGDGGTARLGAFVGGSIKDDDVRAPYPDTYWFSFPNTCPTKSWAKKTDACRTSSHKGLCDVGVAPDGVQCTFAYDILGWIPIDDVVGITKITNKATEEPYSNFTEWCQASPKNNEFVGDAQTGNMKSGLQFWKKPLDKQANQLRAQKVVNLYNQLVKGSFQSSQMSASVVKSFKPLPQIDALRTQNPACYETVPSCNVGNGCRREGYAQLCQPCTKKAAGCATNSEYTFPELTKAKGTKDDDDLVSSVTGSGSSNSTEDDTNSDEATASSDETAIDSPDAPPDQTASSSPYSKKTTAAPAKSSSPPAAPFTSAMAAAMLAVLVVAAHNV